MRAICCVFCIVISFGVKSQTANQYTFKEYSFDTLTGYTIGERDSLGNNLYLEVYDYIDGVKNLRRVAITKYNSKGFKTHEFKGRINSDIIQFTSFPYVEELNMYREYSSTINISYLDLDNGAKALIELNKDGKVFDLLDSHKLGNRILKKSTRYDSLDRIVERILYTSKGDTSRRHIYEYFDDELREVERQYISDDIFFNYWTQKDEEGRPIKRSTTFMMDSTESSITKYEYDEFGNEIASVTSPHMEHEVNSSNEAKEVEYKYLRIEKEYQWNEYLQKYLWKSNSRFLEDQLVSKLNYTYNDRGDLSGMTGGGGIMGVCDYKMEYTYLK